MIEQKFHFGQLFGEAARGGAETMLSLIARSLPASIDSVNGSMAKVKIEIGSDFNFPLIDVPIQGSQYVREPFQKGDKGIVMPCDASIAAMIGLKNASATLDQPGNLSALIFIPLGNSQWTSVDGQMLVLTGLSDVMVRDNTHQVQLEDLNTMLAALSNLITTLNTNFATIGPFLTTPQTFAAIAAIPNAVKPRA